MGAKPVALLLVVTLVLAGCSGATYRVSSGVGYGSTYYGHGRWDPWYDRPIYVVPGDYPELPSEPIAVQLPEPPPDIPDIGGGDIDFGGMDF